MILNLLKKIALAVWSILCVAFGVFVALKFKDPETVVNNSIGKIKGQNDVTNTPTTTVAVGKKKFRLFGKRKKEG